MRSVPPYALTLGLAAFAAAAWADDPTAPQVDAVSSAGQIAPSNASANKTGAGGAQQATPDQVQALRSLANSGVGQAFTQTGKQVYGAFSNAFGGLFGSKPAAPPPSGAHDPGPQPAAQVQPEASAPGDQGGPSPAGTARRPRPRTWPGCAPRSPPTLRR